jgi:hypothetical protein
LLFTLKAKFKPLWLLLCVYCTAGNTQQTSLQADARSVGLGGNLSVLSGHWSCISNPAGLAEAGTAACGLFYTNYFGINELGAGGLACSVPTRSGNFGFGFVSSGFKVLTENQASVSYGRSFGNNFRAGIGLHWLLFSQPSDYRDLYAWIPSMGIQWLPSEYIIAGLTVTNPAQQEYIPSGYRKIPSGFAAGFGYMPSGELLVCVEAAKYSDEKWKYTCGIEAAFKKSVFLRFGINRQEYSCYSFGAGYHYRNLYIDAAISNHPVLGFSPAIGLSCSF